MSFFGAAIKRDASLALQHNEAELVHLSNVVVVGDVKPGDQFKVSVADISKREFVAALLSDSHMQHGCDLFLTAGSVVTFTQIKGKPSKVELHLTGYSEPSEMMTESGASSAEDDMEEPAAKMEVNKRLKSYLGTSECAPAKKAPVQEESSDSEEVEEAQPTKKATQPAAPAAASSSEEDEEDEEEESEEEESNEDTVVDADAAKKIAAAVIAKLKAAEEVEGSNDEDDDEEGESDEDDEEADSSEEDDEDNGAASPAQNAVIEDGSDSGSESSEEEEEAPSPPPKKSKGAAKNEEPQTRTVDRKRKAPVPENSPPAKKPATGDYESAVVEFVRAAGGQTKIGQIGAKVKKPAEFKSKLGVWLKERPKVFKVVGDTVTLVKK